jgi:hypothetical protein
MQSTPYGAHAEEVVPPRNHCVGGKNGNEVQKLTKFSTVLLLFEAEKLKSSCKFVPDVSADKDLDGALEGLVSEKQPEIGAETWRKYKKFCDLRARKSWIWRIDCVVNRIAL